MLPKGEVNNESEKTVAVDAHHVLWCWYRVTFDGIDASRSC